MALLLFSVGGVTGVVAGSAAVVGLQPPPAALGAGEVGHGVPDLGGWRGLRGRAGVWPAGRRRTPENLLNFPNPVAGRAFGKLSTVFMLDFPSRGREVGFGKLSMFFGVS